MRAKAHIKKTPNKPKLKTSKKITKKSIQVNKLKSTGMNDFEQCIVLAAIVNQQRNTDPRFLFTPLPDINSSLLAPLRELLSQYDFTASDITKATHDILQSNLFKECFALHETLKEALLTIKQKDPNNILRELIELAGPEAKKPIFMSEKDLHDIHKTTLEKHALKLGLIEPHYVAPEPYKPQVHTNRIIIRLRLERGFNSQRLTGKQHRGRG